MQYIAQAGETAKVCQPLYHSVAELWSGNIVTRTSR